MIAVVGGGVTGLCLAHYLVARDRDCVVFEADARPGGVVWTRTVDGLPLDLGAQRTRLTRDVSALVRELGLQGQLLLARADLPLFVYRRGRLRPVPFTPRQLLRSSLLTWPGKARLLLEPFTGGARPGETVASFLVRKLGRDAYDALVGPLYGGIYASDPAEMLVELSLARVLEEFELEGSLVLSLLGRRNGGEGLPPAASFRTGMRALPEALLGAHRERVRLSEAVRLVRPDGRGGWRVETERGGEAVREVVLTTPAPVSARLLEEVAPEAAARLGTLRYNPLAVVHLVSGARLHGAGYQVAFGEPLETRGVTWNAALFGRDGLYTAFLGGMRHPGLVDEPDEVLGATATEEFRHVTGADARAVHVHRTWIPAWDRTWTALRGLELPPGIRLCASYESRLGIPGRVREARRLAVELSA